MRRNFAPGLGLQITYSNQLKPADWPGGTSRRQDENEAQQIAVPAAGQIDRGRSLHNAPSVGIGKRELIPRLRCLGINSRQPVLDYQKNLGSLPSPKASR